MEHPHIHTGSARPSLSPNLFSDEDACITLLFQTRWPHGFTCPVCRRCTPSVRPALQPTCPACGRQCSLTGSTPLHGTRKPLTLWMRAFWWLAAGNRGESAKDLQRLLRLTSYQTAWSWMGRLRQIMTLANAPLCAGRVDVGGGRLAPARRRRGRAQALAAAEISAGGADQNRVRLRQVETITSENVAAFVNSCIARDSTVYGPATGPFLQARLPANIDCRLRGKSNPDSISTLLASVERWLHTTHRGAVSHIALQPYLEEYGFRRNARQLDDPQATFATLVRSCMTATSCRGAAK